MSAPQLVEQQEIRGEASPIIGNKFGKLISESTRAKDSFSRAESINREEGEHLQHVASDQGLAGQESTLEKFCRVI